MGPRQRTGIATAVVLVVGAVAAAIALTTGDDTTGQSRDQANRSAPASDPQTRRAAAATDALAALEEAVRAEDRDAFGDVFAGDQADQLFDTLTALPLKEWDLRFVAEATTASTSWVGDVEVAWSLDGFDARPAETEVDVTFSRPEEGTATIRQVEPDADARTPEWLLGETVVRQSRGTLVISARGGGAAPEGETAGEGGAGLTKRVLRQAREAVRDVRRVVGEARDPVVVVVPPTTEALADLLGGDPADYEQIAAVTSTADGTSDASAPVRVAVNPPVYRNLGRAGAQVVISHEATHAMTGAATTQVPLWLVEGFADYVALEGEPVPLETAASQILGQVRADGPPKNLPSEKDFDSTSPGLGAKYEAAWLVCRMIAEEYGEPALVRFYQRALRSGDVDTALRDTLGTDTRGLTRDWQAYLEELA